MFDMRKDKALDVLTHSTAATQLGKLSPQPVVHVRQMFGSASDARKAGHTYAA